MLVIFLVLFSFLLPAQEKSRAQNLYLKQLSVEEGLSQGTVSSIITDRKGFVWLATENGLNVYDGYSIKQLPGPNNSFLDAVIHFVKQEVDGSVWINVNDALYRYHPSTNEYEWILNSSDDDAGQYVVGVIQGNNSVNKAGYWIATNKNIGFYDPETSKFQIKLDLSKTLHHRIKIFQITLHQQTLYVATQAGIYAYNTKNNTWKKLPNISTLPSKNRFNSQEATKNYALYISKQNELYFGTNDGVFSVNIENINEFISGNSPLARYKLIQRNLSVWQFLFTNEKLYVASNKGLHVIDTIKQSSKFLFRVSDYFENTSDDRIISLAKDSRGVFWLGSVSKGVYLWDPRRELVKNYRYQRENDKSLSDNAVRVIQHNSTNNDLFWVGTGNGLNLIDDQQNSVRRYHFSSKKGSQLSDSRIKGIYNYNKELLILTHEGIVFYNTELNQVSKPRFTLEINKVLASVTFSVFLQQQRYLWLVQEDGASLIDLTLGQKVNLSALNNVVPLTHIYQFLGSLPNSNAMLFSTNDSLWSFDLATNKVVKLYQHPGILASEWLAFDSWTIDKNNVFWLAYPGKGLVGLALSTFKVKYFYHSNNSIIDNNVYSLMTDTEGDIWFSTHKGMFLLNSDTQHMRNFTIDDGFPALEFNAEARLPLVNGNFVYGSMGGVSIFDPLKLKNKDADKKLKVHVTNIEVLSRKLDLPLIINQQQEMQLKYDDVGIRLDFSTLFYGAHQNVVFEYQLMGDSDINYPATTKNSITFPSLPSGLHTLSVKVKSPVNGEYSATSQINLRVSYPPWQSPTAYFMYAMTLLLLALYWAYQRHLQRLKLFRAHEEVTYRENRLQLALIGSNSDVWDWQAHNNLMFCKRIAQELGYVDLEKVHRFEQHVELIHPDDKENYLAYWQTFFVQNSLDETFSCTYRLKHIAGHWLWYKDLGKIVTLDDDNTPNRITGSYSNVTLSREENVRSQYYGEAFKQTNDWVLIINDDYIRATANQSLCNAFGWSDEEFDFTNNFMGLSRRRWRFFQYLLPSLTEGEHWSGEELVTTDQGKAFHVILNINVGRNQINNSLYFVLVFSDISAQKVAEKKLRFLANYDHLTNLPNRSLLLERVESAMALSMRQSRAFALFFIDLDRFKQVNDSLGHDCGDLLLIEVSRRLSEILHENDTIARIGGDEFVVLLEAERGISHLGNIAQKIISAVERPMLLRAQNVSVGASIGIAIYPEDANDSSALLRHADIAMYQAKQLGRNTFQFFTPRMNFEANERLKKESNVKLAYSNDQFINFYQPIIDTNNGVAIGFELLMRWQSSSGLIAPSGFITMAEELGLIIPMTESALERGLIDLKKWHKIRPTLYLSINLSPQHFAKQGLVEYIASLLKTHNIPAPLLKIEVTESALFLEPEKAIKTMNLLSLLGVTLALDDFGTGFSSLSYLKRLPLDIIKIDQTFVAGIGVEKTDEAIVDATIVLAKRLNMLCIAEGVETKEQLAYLTERECHYIQGFLYSKPVDAKVINDFLTANTEDKKSIN